ncbi:putative Tas protein [Escherichia coli]|uniref:Putative Tas protein n=1 Tax=Escherichia coli TaxID=562 RepID=A0A485JGW4_ECOLX|nr:putative Tas protein [Escherichia coli]
MAEVFTAAMSKGLNLWDTAAVYGMGSSETALGALVHQFPRENIILSTKFTPQIADKQSAQPVSDMLEASLGRLGVTNGAIVIHTQRLKSDPGGNLLS